MQGSTALIARCFVVLLAGCIAREYRTGVGFPSARTGGKCTIHYNSLNELTPVIFVTQGEKAN